MADNGNFCGACNNSFSCSAYAVLVVCIRGCTYFLGNMVPSLLLGGLYEVLCFQASKIHQHIVFKAHKKSIIFYGFAYAVQTVQQGV